MTIDEAKNGLLPNAYRCKKCGSVNVELRCDIYGYYVKCEDCGRYFGGKNIICIVFFH